MCFWTSGSTASYRTRSSHKVHGKCSSWKKGKNRCVDFKALLPQINLIFKFCFSPPINFWEYLILYFFFFLSFFFFFSFLSMMFLKSIHVACICLFKWFVWKVGWEGGETQKERESLSSGSLHKVTAARHGPRWSQEPGTPLGSPTWVAGPSSAAS